MGEVREVKNWAQSLIVLLLMCGTNCFGPQPLSAQTNSLDLNDPKDALSAYRKIFCSLRDGFPVVYWWKGQVYSRIPGEKDRHLFNIQGMNIRESRVSDEDENVGYRLVSREVNSILDFRFWILDFPLPNRRLVFNPSSPIPNLTRVGF
jgi:hypothetical protein